jgi:NAD(P)-dependent dehydrogenase (short-subunit alcohol dehydrogenase family)
MTEKEKVAVVTGASSGIGQAVAIALAQNGFRVVITARRKERLERSIALAGAAADRMLSIPADVADHEAVKAVFERTEQAFGRLDLLFNNAGSNIPATPMEDIAANDWRRVIDVNLTGSFFCAQAAMRIMKKQTPMGGRIVNNGSAAAHVPRMRGIAYAASKHAITGLTKAISLEGREFDISCCQLDLGNVAVERNTGLEKGTLQADGTMKPEPRMHVDSVIKAILFMASLPNTVSVPTLLLTDNKMPLLGRG